RSLATARQSSQELLPEPRRHHTEPHREHGPGEQGALEAEKAHEREQRLNRDTAAATTTSATSAAIFEVVGPALILNTHGCLAAGLWHGRRWRATHRHAYVQSNTVPARDGLSSPSTSAIGHVLWMCPISMSYTLPDALGKARRKSPCGLHRHAELVLPSDACHRWSRSPEGFSTPGHAGAAISPWLHPVPAYFGGRWM